MAVLDVCDGLEQYQLSQRHHEGLVQCLDGMLDVLSELLQRERRASLHPDLLALSSRRALLPRLQAADTTATWKRLGEQTAAAEATLVKTQAEARAEWGTGNALSSCHTTRAQKKTSALSLSGRYTECEALEEQVKRFCHETGAEQQPSRKLFDAIVTAKERNPLDARFASLSLTNAQALVPAPDKRIILSGHQLRLRIQTAMLRDQLELLDKLPEAGPWIAKLQPAKLAASVLTGCQDLVKESLANDLLRQAAQSMVAYARITAAVRSSRSARADDADKMTGYVGTARELLCQAAELCKQPFDGGGTLRAEVENAQRLLGKEWYEPVTAKELGAIKSAMVSGPSGISTHSGHWYKCQNGHVFAIGNCGMPMELGRCPECGSGIGGQNGTYQAGVRAGIRPMHG
ncbi:hypothetical protein B0T25DRAFT_563650 [Lasiosphaeria hispida]|uniref:RZ-type domain-containing protein n=1 Tax=Lasiosphaeria hispida TaxID=260671 RepID=A0AAJ0HXW4_9PEZI|nr:hypothetical protein B0T25DRAFT_563650 [Lasiosphaeria hispida]